MTHEHFTAFKIPNGQLLTKEADSFLNNGHVIRSISLCELTGSKEIILTLGYDSSEKSAHKYHMVSENIGHSNMDVEEIAEKINKVAKKLEGVICQDLTEVGGSLILTFLTHAK